MESEFPLNITSTLYVFINYKVSSKSDKLFKTKWNDKKNLFR